jgi:uncharacterized protein YndB with AHSA1/START domain
MSMEGMKFDTVETSAVIDRPIEDVWQFISDFSNATKWELYSEGEQTSPAPTGLGTTFRFGGKFMGKDLTYEGRISEWEPNKKFTFWSDKFIRKKPAYLQFTLEPVGNGTKMTTVYAAAALTGLWRLVKPILLWSFKRERLEGNVKRILESQASA